MYEEIGKLSPELSRGTPRMVAIVASLVAFNGHSAAAQMDAQARVQNSVVISLTQTRPMGALAANIGSGYGVFGSFLLPLDRGGVVSLRADLGVAEYGHDTKRTPFSDTVGGRVEVNVHTTNTVVPGSIGFQLTPSLGTVHPYVNAGVGAQVFFTDSSVEPTTGGGALASTTNQWDAAFAWTLGGGLYVPVTERLANVLLDIGVQYIKGGRAQYLAPGSIVDLDGGRISVTPMESTTDLLALRFGARIGL